jgi:hypothetical protein
VIKIMNLWIFGKSDCQSLMFLRTMKKFLGVVLCLLLVTPKLRAEKCEQGNHEESSVLLKEAHSMDLCQRHLELLKENSRENWAIKSE